MSLQLWDLILQPLDYESLSITTRLGLPPIFLANHLPNKTLVVLASTAVILTNEPNVKQRATWMSKIKSSLLGHGVNIYIFIDVPCSWLSIDKHIWPGLSVDDFPSFNGGRSVAGIRTAARSDPGREPWSSGYGKRLKSKRSWVQIRHHILDGHFWPI